MLHGARGAGAKPGVATGTACGDGGMDMDGRVLRVVVASPADVASERNAVTKVFEEINHGSPGTSVSCS
jgi:hypothetical protein